MCNRPCYRGIISRVLDIISSVFVTHSCLPSFDALPFFLTYYCAMSCRAEVVVRRWTHSLCLCTGHNAEPRRRSMRSLHRIHDGRILHSRRTGRRQLRRLRQLLARPVGAKSHRTRIQPSDTPVQPPLIHSGTYMQFYSCTLL